jgi:hypothetical protein
MVWRHEGRSTESSGFAVRRQALARSIFVCLQSAIPFTERCHQSRQWPGHVQDQLKQIERVARINFGSSGTTVRPAMRLLKAKRLGQSITVNQQGYRCIAYHREVSDRRCACARRRVLPVQLVRRSRAVDSRKGQSSTSAVSEPPHQQAWSNPESRGFQRRKVVWGRTSAARPLLNRSNDNLRWTAGKAMRAEIYRRFHAALRGVGSHRFVCGLMLS